MEQDVDCMEQDVDCMEQDVDCIEQDVELYGAGCGIVWSKMWNLYFQD